MNGTSHDAAERRETDAERDAYLHARGYTVLRLRNDIVFTDVRAALQEITRTAKTNEAVQPFPAPAEPPPPR